MCFDQCPSEYKSRYVDGVALELSEALVFGSSVHRALEAHYQGADAERAFLAAWRTESKLLPRVSPNLTGIGLDLLDKVIALDLRGVPERGFSLDMELLIGAPIVGAIDLWGDGVIYDFKTTRGVWSAERAQTETWQPVIYTQAYFQEVGEWPDFEYIVLNRVTGQLDRFRREWTIDSWAAQWSDAYGRMRQIAALVEAGDFACPRMHGYCPECGERWGHAHVCELTNTSRRIKL